MGGFGVFKVLSLLSVRSVLSHKVKSLIVGWIMLFGTFLVVLGTSLLDSVEKSMAKSITGSLAGHLQVYDKNARDSLALFGGTSMGKEDLGRIRDFSVVKSSLEKIDNVGAVVPMGIDFSVVTQPGETDRALSALRAAVHAGDRETMNTLAKQVRQLAGLMAKELENVAAVSSDQAKIKHGREVLARAQTDELWAKFETDPLGVLELLDTEMAPLSQDGKLIYVRYLGTDLDLFAKNFDRFEIVDGQMVPPGHRGLLFNKKTYEEYIKHRVAAELDFIRKNVIEQEKSIASDGILAAHVSQLPRQYQRITFQLDAEESKKLEGLLKAKFPEVTGGLDDLLKKFLTVDEKNIDERHKFFYEHIAPMVQLYDVPVGETLTLRGFTKSGYLKAVNVKVYGTFKFRGLERSEVAGGHNLIDIQTFRDLYGYMTEERKKELDQIRGEVGAKTVDRASAEQDLFGGSGASAESVVQTREAGAGFDEFKGAELEKTQERAAQASATTFTQADIDHGVALNAAVVLKDPDKIVQTAAAISAASEKDGLGVQVVDWQTASGVIGQFIIVVRIVLYVAIFIIFTVALVIINNSMVTATMERVTEIGTMRAIGAQRRFVMAMFLLETILLGLFAGGLGVALGAGAVNLLHSVGLAAKTDVLVFLFAGPRLYPEFGAHNLIIGFVAILLVSIASTLYPARIATKIQPVVAMQRKE